MQVTGQIKKFPYYYVLVTILTNTKKEAVIFLPKITRTVQKATYFYIFLNSLFHFQIHLSRLIRETGLYLTIKGSIRKRTEPLFFLFEDYKSNDLLQIFI